VIDVIVITVVTEGLYELFMKYINLKIKLYNCKMYFLLNSKICIFHFAFFYSELSVLSNKRVDFWRMYVPDVI